MENQNKIITAFFNAYEDRFNKALADPQENDVDGTVAAFADCFIEAGPAGVNCGKNNEHFRKAIPQGNDFYRKLGTTSMKITKMDITPLDAFHVMVKVYWHSRYQKNGKKTDISFEVIYFLQVLKGQAKIFAYITGDEQKVLKEYGLLEEQAEAQPQ